ncbi:MULTISPECIES: hypothetical protein [Bacillus cereus group]|uniref:Lipoprotein n=1 Tax=Bacillus cereus TaxID=1396 RepID=A0A9X6VVS8_BACCE|nr:MULTISPECIES: hypothetical protein [Bacillus cereus group]PFF46002.1 hypothetical protein CN357_21345 [Bacillus cereus]PFQ36525.1 hypothetical protein COK33_17315 [Bacillus cereus]PGB17855.1 hypothetical protein COM09_03450 [Bacillus toyonensis]
MKLSTKSLSLLLGCSFLLFGCSSEDTKESNHKEKETVSNKGVKPIEELIYKQVDSRDDGYKDYYYRVYYNHANKCVSEQHMVEGGYSIPIMTSNYFLDSETKQPMCGKSIEEAKALFQVKEKSNDLNKG